jgi:radical SAM superfamily enzyme YgiQ (UPF0313 family)
MALNAHLAPERLENAVSVLENPLHFGSPTLDDNDKGIRYDCHASTKHFSSKIQTMAEIILIHSHTGPLDEMSLRLPEGLLAIAALPAAKGYDVSIVDQRISGDFYRDVAAAVGPETVIFGVSCMTGAQIGFSVDITTVLKEKWPHIPICWGGVHATLLPEQTGAHPAIDYVIAGDGDLVFCELFERLRDGEPVDDLRGLIYKTEGDPVNNAGEVVLEFKKKGGYRVVRRNGSTDVIKDLDSLPPLPYHLVDFDRYGVFHTGDGTKSSTLNTARGCPYRCTFCSDPVLNDGRWRGFSPEKIIERLNVLHNEHDVGFVYFQDDYFPGSKKRFIKVLQALADEYQGKLKWGTCGIRADILCQFTDEEMDLLERSGCHSLEVGVETGSERMIKLLVKAETLDQFHIANEKLARTNIKVKYSFIIGFPTETDEEMQETIELALELERKNPNSFCFVFNFMPIMGTPLFEGAVKMGFHAPTTLEGWADLDFQKWMHNYSSWHKPEKIRRLEAISFTSYFHNKNVVFKLGGSRLLRFCYRCYYPIAKWRFENQRFGMFVEWYIKDAILALRPLVNMFSKMVSLARGEGHGSPSAEGMVVTDNRAG